MANGYIPAEVERGCDPCRPTRVEQKAFLGGVLGIDVNGERQPISEAGIVDLTFIEEETREAAEQAIASAQAAAESEQTASEAAASARSSESAAQTAASAAEAAKADAEDAASSANASKNTADSYATAAQTAAAAAQVADGNAERSAESAIAAAAQAASSAGAAQQYANEAYTSASTAQTASGAAQDAQTAAEASASTASSAATTATQAKTAAQAAQTAAETAQAAAAQSATAASGSATAAAGSATQAAASATAADASAAAAAQSAAAAQAAAMDVIDKAPIITDTASGAIASFPDGSAAPIKQLTVAVNPVQDLHGYDSPWPAGGGVNLFNKNGTTIANGYIDTNTGTWKSSTSHKTAVIPCKPNTAYTASKVAVNSNNQDRLGIAYVNSSTLTNGAVLPSYSVKQSGFTAGTRYSVTVTTGEEAQLLVVWISRASEYDDSIPTLQVEVGSTATPYAPYSNVCPITGWTGAEVTRTGRNLLGGLALGQAIVNAVNDSTKSSLGENTDGKYVTISASTAVDGKAFFNTFKPNTQYTLILRITRYQTGLKNSNILFRYTDGTYKTISFTTTSDTEVVTIAVTSDASKTLKQVETVYGGGTTRLFYEQSGIFEGVVTTDEFEPYTGATYEVEFPSESGTVYGGTVTVNQDGTGTLVAKHSLFTVNSFAGVWGATSNGYAVYTTISGTYRTNAARSSLFAYNGNGYQTMPVWTFCGGSGAQGTVSFILPSTITSKAEANAWLASLDTPLTVYIKRATPVTYTLTAAEMTALLGTNNWWADTGNVTVNYRADTKLYIDKKLAALLAALS